MSDKRISFSTYGHQRASVEWLPATDFGAIEHCIPGPLPPDAGDSFIGDSVSVRTANGTYSATLPHLAPGVKELLLCIDRAGERTFGRKFRSLLAADPNDVSRD
jgi:hypothetical protein